MEKLSNLFNKISVSTFDINQIEAEEKMTFGFIESETRRRRSFPILQTQVTDDLKDIPAEGIINCFRGNHCNPKILKSDLQRQGDAVAKRNRKPTEKELFYSQQVLLDKRKRISGNIRNSIESGLHLRTISKQFSWSHALMKLFLHIHREYDSRLNDKEQKLDNHWFREVDQEIFAFKHSRHKFLQENQDAQSRKSS